MWILSFCVISDEIGVITEQYQLLTDTYDEIIDTIDYCRHVFTLDERNGTILARMSEIEDIERSKNRANASQRYEYQQLADRVGKAKAWSHGRVSVYLQVMKGQSELWLADFRSGLTPLPTQRTDIAGLLRLTPTLAAEITVIDEQLCAIARKSGNIIDKLSQNTAKKEKTEEKQHASIDISDLPDIVDIPAKIAKNIQRNQQVKKGKK